MKKLISSIFISFALIASSPFANASAPKANQICKKFGETKIYAKQTLKCSKVGTKQIWKILKDPKNNLVYSKNEAVVFEAINKIKALKASQLDFITSTYIDDGFNSRAISDILLSQNKVLSIFGSYFTKDTKFTYIFGNSKQYILDTMRSIGANEIWLNSILDSINFAYPDQIPPGRPMWGAGNYLNGDKKSIVISYYSYPKYSYTNDVEEIGAHEIFHFVQQAENSNVSNLPCWILEGQASIIGTAFIKSNNTIEEISKHLAAYGSAHSAGADLSKIEAPNGWENHGSCGDVGEYQQGRIANALLINKVGVPKTIEYLKNMSGQIRDGISWKRKFIETFNISVEDFYKDANLYLQWYYLHYFDQKL